MYYHYLTKSGVFDKYIINEICSYFMPNEENIRAKKDYLCFRFINVMFGNNMDGMDILRQSDKYIILPMVGNYAVMWFYIIEKAVFPSKKRMNGVGK